MTEKLHNQAQNLVYKVKDLMDEPNHPVAKRLTSEVQGLEDDTQVGKNPLSVVDRIKRIIRLLEDEAEEARIMDNRHLSFLRDQFEELRQAAAEMA